MFQLQGPRPESPEQIDALLEQLRPELAGILAGRRIPLQDWGDVLQDVLVRLIRGWEEVESPEAWLLAHVRFECLMYWRRRRRELVDRLDEVVERTLQSHEGSPPPALVSDLQRILRQLPERCRALFRLRFELGHSADEVADQLGYRRSSMAKITRRCRTALAEALARAGLSSGGDSLA